MGKDRSPQRTPPPDGQWYVNDRGQTCYEGQCFGLVGDPTTGEFLIEFDDQCAAEGAAQAEKAFLRNVLEQRGVTYRKRRRRHD